jgi:hypothetical protein
MGFNNGESLYSKMDQIGRFGAVGEIIAKYKIATSLKLRTSPLQ